MRGRSGMSEVWPMIHPKFSFRRIGVRWLIQLPTSFQEYNENGSTCKKSKKPLIKSPNANQVLKNCAIKSRSVNYFGAENRAIWIRFYRAVWGWFFYLEKLHSVNRHLEFPPSHLHSQIILTCFMFLLWSIQVLFHCFARCECVLWCELIMTSSDTTRVWWCIDISTSMYHTMAQSDC